MTLEIKYLTRANVQYLAYEITEVKKKKRSRTICDENDCVKMLSDHLIGWDERRLLDSVSFEITVHVECSCHQWHRGYPFVEVRNNFVRWAYGTLLTVQKHTVNLSTKKVKPNCDTGDVGAIHLG